MNHNKIYQMKKYNYLNRLSGLRFVAASYTIFFHYWSFPDSNFLNSFVSHGHISVPFFFLLSGFVLSYSYDQFDFSTHKKKITYLKNRLLRILPLYYLSLLLCIPMFYLKYKASPLSLGELIASFFGHLTFSHSLFPFSKIINSWNVHTWSLSVEAFLYLLSPFIFSMLSKINLKRRILFLALSVFVNCAIFILDLSRISLFDKISSFFAPLYVSIFFIGILLAKFYIKYEYKLSKFSFWGFWGSSVSLIMLFSMGLDEKFYSSFNPIFIFLFSVLIISSCFPLRSNSFMGSKLMIHLGDASYGMYILQAPAKVFFQQIYSKLLGGASSEGLIYNLYIYISIVIFSMLATKIFDKKMREIFKTEK